MVDVVFSLGRVLAALFLVLLNGFFVASEFAYVRIRSTAVDRLVDEGAPGASHLREAVDNLDDYLAVTQLGITIASLGLGWIGEPAVAALIEPVVSPFLPESLMHLVAFAIGFGVITFLHVVYGELAPKTIAIARPERIALAVSPFMRLFYYLFVPGIIVFNGTANFTTRLIGIPPASETEETLTEEEILTVLSRSGKKGHVDRSEVEMIEQVFELDDMSVREIMIPRPDVVSVSEGVTLPELRSIVVEHGHTRYPVVEEEDREQVVGYVDVKDLLRASDSGSDETADVIAGDLVRDIPVVPETGQINDLLNKFQTEQTQIAAVVDEWGAFEGIVTVEDVIEVVVGDIRDEFDVAAREPMIDRNEDGTFTVDGGVPISEINETLGADFEAEGFGTIGGLVFDRLGRAPQIGDEITSGAYALEVLAVEGARIDSVEVREASGEEEQTG
jgi:CBS domain containing-hemolysin-like protein